MSSPANSPQRLFYLGIEGEQTGPFSEGDVLQKIEEGQVTAETLIWSDGMADWLPITSLKSPYERTLQGNPIYLPRTR